MKVFSVLVTLSIVIFSGCGASKSLAVKNPNSIMNDKSMAYVIFGVADAPLHTFNAKIMRVDKDTLQPTLIAIIEDGEKYIDKIEPGEHLYFIDSNIADSFITEDRFVTIDASPGELIYVSATTGVVLSPKREILTEKIKKSNCSYDEIKHYGFNEIEQVEDRNTNEFTQKSEGIQNIIYDNELFGYKLICKDNKIMELKDKRFLTITEVDSLIAVLTKKEELAQFNAFERDKVQKNIKNLHPIMVIKHKNILQKASYLSPFKKEYIEILKYTSPHNANKYAWASISKLSTNANMSQSDTSEFNEAILKKLIHKKMPIEQGLTIKYEVKNYIPGNQAIRYTGFTESQRLGGLESLQMNVQFIDNLSGNLLGEIEYNAYISGGIFGGSIGLISDASDAISSYVKMNFIK